MTRLKWTTGLAFALALAACNSGSDTASGDDAAGDEAEGEAMPNPDAPVSILRSDVEQPEAEQEELEPLNATIGFPAGGSDLDADAIAALETVLASEQLAMDGPITLGAHSDAGGSDAANARASEARGLAVAAWLIENGVDEKRIEVIVFGEQNPVQSNALPNGEPNEEGRAANRRVEVLIGVPPKSKFGTPQ